MNPPCARLVLVAPDIACERCREQIEADLARADGVHGVAVELATRAVTVDYDPTATDPRALRATLAATGYPPDE